MKEGEKKNESGLSSRLFFFFFFLNEVALRKKTTVSTSQSSPESESESYPRPLMLFFSTFVNFVPDLCVTVGGSIRLPLETEKKEWCQNQYRLFLTEWRSDEKMEESLCLTCS